MCSEYLISSKRKDNFTQRLLAVLRQHPSGMSEFELMRKLESEGEPGFNSENRRENLTLFQMHFFLFHHLYLLRDSLFKSKQAILDISPLSIILRPFLLSNNSSIDQHDQLREYYLDLHNLNSTTIGDIDDLLNLFWQKLLKNDRRIEALAILGLKDPVSWGDIKAQYRRLVMEHHPDRGGDVERLQIINAALEILKR